MIRVRKIHQETTDLMMIIIVTIYYGYFGKPRDTRNAQLVPLPIQILLFFSATSCPSAPGAPMTLDVYVTPITPSRSIS